MTMTTGSALSVMASSLPSSSSCMSQSRAMKVPLRPMPALQCTILGLVALSPFFSRDMSTSFSRAALSAPSGTEKSGQPAKRRCQIFLESLPSSVVMSISLTCVRASSSCRNDTKCRLCMKPSWNSSCSLMRMSGIEGDCG